jgi:hypothetical protein
VLILAHRKAVGLYSLVVEFLHLNGELFIYGELRCWVSIVRAHVTVVQRRTVRCQAAKELVRF